MQDGAVSPAPEDFQGQRCEINEQGRPLTHTARWPMRRDALSMLQKRVTIWEGDVSRSNEARVREWIKWKSPHLYRLPALGHLQPQENKQTTTGTKNSGSLVWEGRIGKTKTKMGRNKISFQNSTGSRLKQKLTTGTSPSHQAQRSSFPWRRTIVTQCFLWLRTAGEFLLCD